MVLQIVMQIRALVAPTREKRNERIPFECVSLLKSRGARERVESVLNSRKKIY